MPTWPATLPDVPLLDGYRPERASGATSTGREGGPFQARLRFTVSTERHQASFLITGEQLRTFERFLYEDTAGGALSFWLRHPTSRRAERFRFDPERMPTWSPLGLDRWRLSVLLIHLPT